MKLTAEITLYPLQEQYLDIIKGCIAKINQYDELLIETFHTATVINGDYSKVMQLINELVAWTYQEFGKSVFVVKFIPGHEID